MKSCEICGFDRATDRSHLIPVSVVKQIPGWEKFLSYDGDHIITLCKNHHFLFDKGRLSKEEKAILAPHMKRFKREIEELLNSRYKYQDPQTKNLKEQKKYKLEYNRRQRLLDRWKDQVGDLAGFERVEYAGTIGYKEIR